MSRRFVCAVVGCGAGSPKFTREVEERAIIVGQMAASAGFITLTGGYGGVMRAAAEGAQSKKGLTMGITRGEAHDDGNAYLDIVIPSGIGYARNSMTALACDVMVALSGGVGTLQEMTYAIEYGRPVLSWGAWPMLVFDGLEYVAKGYMGNDGAVQVKRWLEERFNGLTEERGET